VLVRALSGTRLWSLELVLKRNVELSKSSTTRPNNVNNHQFVVQVNISDMTGNISNALNIPNVTTRNLGQSIINVNILVKQVSLLIKVLENVNVKTVLCTINHKLTQTAIITTDFVSLSPNVLLELCGTLTSLDVRLKRSVVIKKSGMRSTGDVYLTLPLAQAHMTFMENA